VEIFDWANLNGFFFYYVIFPIKNDPNKILNSVPVQQPTNVVNAGLNIEHTLQPINIQTASTPVLQAQTVRDPNQLEFDFDNCSYSKTIFERLDSMDRKLTQILELFKKTENLD
jgi:hypothetical protein